MLCIDALGDISIEHLSSLQLLTIYKEENLDCWVRMWWFNVNVSKYTGVLVDGERNDRILEM